jgi:hypothetical protein
VGDGREARLGVWIGEMIFYVYDAELENTALFLSLLNGSLLLSFKPDPVFNRGSEFQAHPDGRSTYGVATAPNR